MQTRVLAGFCLIPLLGWDSGADQKAWAAESAATNYFVSRYVVAGYQVPPTNTLPALFSKYSGTNVGLGEIVKAASELQWDYRSRGYTNVSISIAVESIANGLVTLHAFRAPSGDILVSGRPFPHPNHLARPATPDRATESAALTKTATATAAAGRNAPAAERAPATPRFVVKAYEVTGDTLLSTNTLTSIFAKYTGANVALTNIVQAASDLQMEYRNRRYPTVTVTIPQQQITNETVQIRVFEGLLSDIRVTQNRYFSSNNVMRTLPSLRTNIILNSALFQAELDRANANQDRQIYGRLEPGLEENTTALNLEVKDRLPLHAKVDFNDQSSPGTPELRLNTSAAYNNLWQLEHSMGVQYSFSPEAFKKGNQWDFYDLPLVANYSAFYRLPLGNPDAISQAVASQPGTFGYDEASRRFRLPPTSGRPEVNVYASRSSIDTGLMTLNDRILTETEAVTVRRRDVQQDLTVNESVGFRLSQPLASASGLRSFLSGGTDWKAYDFMSQKTNLFTFTTVIHDQNNIPVRTNVSIVPSAVPTTQRALDYLPLSLRYDGNLRDSRGVTVFGLGLSGNTWHSGSLSNLQSITGSAESSGNWVILTPSISRDFQIRTNWILSLRGEGQWTSEPLISNDQIGIGGLNSVRGYREGEVFGDTGWWIGFEQKTPPQVIGMAYRNHPLTVRGSLYMQYGEAYLLDPQGRQDRTRLWGTGFGGVASVGATWEARFFFSLPLLDAGTTSAMKPRFDFSLSAQF